MLAMRHSQETTANESLQEVPARARIQSSMDSAARDLTRHYSAGGQRFGALPHSYSPVACP
jgi:hypothetical protein